jgi:hypothetical protein
MSVGHLPFAHPIAVEGWQPTVGVGAGAGVGLGLMMTGGLGWGVTGLGLGTTRTGGTTGLGWAGVEEGKANGHERTTQTNCSCWSLPTCRQQLHQVLPS